MFCIVLEMDTDAAYTLSAGCPICLGLCILTNTVTIMHEKHIYSFSEYNPGMIQAILAAQILELQNYTCSSNPRAAAFFFDNFSVLQL